MNNIELSSSEKTFPKSILSKLENESENDEKKIQNKICRNNIKNLSLVLCVISLLIWWEIPALAIIFTVANGVLILNNYDKSSFYKIMIALCASLLCISVWNWDLHIGMQLLEWYYG